MLVTLGNVYLIWFSVELPVAKTGPAWLPCSKRTHNYTIYTRLLQGLGFIRKSDPLAHFLQQKEGSQLEQFELDKSVIPESQVVVVITLNACSLVLISQSMQDLIYVRRWPGVTGDHLCGGYLILSIVVMASLTLRRIPWEVFLQFRDYYLLV